MTKWIVDYVVPRPGVEATGYQAKTKGMDHLIQRVGLNAPGSALRREDIDDDARSPGSAAHPQDHTETSPPRPIIAIAVPPRWAG